MNRPCLLSLSPYRQSRQIWKSVEKVQPASRFCFYRWQSLIKPSGYRTLAISRATTQSRRRTSCAQPSSRMPPGALLTPSAGNATLDGSIRSYSSSFSDGRSQSLRRAYIALGSNVGDRLEMIEKACLALDQDPDIRLLRTSSLYETAPMYVEDQDPFLNGACEVCS